MPSKIEWKRGRWDHLVRLYEFIDRPNVLKDNDLPLSFFKVPRNDAFNVVDPEGAEHKAWSNLLRFFHRHCGESLELPCLDTSALGDHVRSRAHTQFVVPDVIESIVYHAIEHVEDNTFLSLGQTPKSDPLVELLVLLQTYTSLIYPQRSNPHLSFEHYYFHVFFLLGCPKEENWIDCDHGDES